MARPPRKRKLIKKLKEVEPILGSEQTNQLTDQIDNLINEIKKEDALTEEVRVFWESPHGNIITLSSLFPRKDLDWYRAVLLHLEKLLDLLPPSKPIIDNLPDEYKNSLIPLLLSLSKKARETAILLRKK